MPPNVELIQYADKLRSETIGCRIRHEKMGTRRTLTKSQIEQAAAPFHATRNALSASKKLFDTRHPAYREVVRIRSRATKYWQSTTVPYPEKGVRLIRKDQVDAFAGQMSLLKSELDEAVANLQEHWADLREKAREDLGELFNDGDYPGSIVEEFDLAWDFPNLDAPAYLKQLHPQIYEQEQQRIRARFEEAVSLAEQSFAEQFHKLVSHLAERLRGDIDGKPKVFRDSAVENLTGFFEQFKSLNIGSSSELEGLIEQAKGLVKGVSAEELREDQQTRQQVGEGLASIEQTLDELMVARPKRQIDLSEEEG